MKSKMNWAESLSQTFTVYNFFKKTPDLDGGVEIEEGFSLDVKNSESYVPKDRQS
jgi:hypothetical protein